jgi:O-antigen ligase
LLIRRFPSLDGGWFPGLLLVSVYGFALAQLLGRGIYRQFLYLCAFALLGLLVSRRGALRLERPMLLLLALGAVLLAQGWVLAEQPMKGGFHAALACTLLVVGAIQYLPAPPRLGLVAAGLAFAVLAHSAGYLLKLNEAGLYANLHYLALFSVLTLPVLSYCAIRLQGWRRWLCALAVFGDFWLLLKTQSRPGYLALLAGALVTVPFLSRRYRMAAFGGILLLPSLLYLTGAFGFAARINDLVAHFFEEERMFIWRESWRMQQDSTLLQWGLGHGFGAYYWDYQRYSSFHLVEEFTFPHNYFLELLYSHGLVGLVLVTLAYGLFFATLASAIRRAAPQRKLAGITLFSAASAGLALGFLTLPVFSRHNLYPFSLILGASLVYLRETDTHEST